MKPTLCIFANFFIDNDERLKRMKDSFHSFHDVDPDEWIINIRGRLKKQAGDFLYKNIGNKLSLNYLQTKKGWFKDSYSIMKPSKSSHILVWVEDNICLINPKKIKEILFEMQKHSVDQTQYSLYNRNTLSKFDLIQPIAEDKNIKVYKIDDKSVSLINKNIEGYFFTVSLVSIFERSFFFKILLSNRPFFKRHSKYLPFDFEKIYEDRVVEKYITAISKYEIFANIDTTYVEGYSLIQRGLYPNRFSQLEMKEMELGLNKSNFIVLFKKFAPNFIWKISERIIHIIKRLFYSIDYFF